MQVAIEKQPGSGVGVEREALFAGGLGFDFSQFFFQGRQALLDTLLLLGCQGCAGRGQGDGKCQGIGVWCFTKNHLSEPRLVFVRFDFRPVDADLMH
ncbi:MAG: hypothetical protein HUJ18_05475 [Marinobacter sp.]|nr:hypothetical protein [Marinobacter sp.]